MPWRDNHGVLRSDIHRPGNRGDSERELDFQTGHARLVKRPGEQARLESTRISFWVGATPKDQGRES